MGAANYLQELQKQSSQIVTDLGKIGQAALPCTDNVTSHPLQSSSSNEASKNDRLRCLEIEQAVENERLSFFLKGEDAALQAKKTFYSAPVPLAIVATDGKFLEMNAMFVNVSRLPMDCLLQISLFNLIQPSCLQDFYSKFADMLLPRKIVTFPFIHIHTYTHC